MSSPIHIPHIRSFTLKSSVILSFSQWQMLHLFCGLIEDIANKLKWGAIFFQLEQFCTPSSGLYYKSYFPHIKNAIYDHIHDSKVLSVVWKNWLRPNFVIFMFWWINYKIDHPDPLMLFIFCAIPENACNTHLERQLTWQVTKTSF